MSRGGVPDLLSRQAAERLVALSRRSATIDNASAALRDALALAGAEVVPEREVETLFELLERIDHQSRILQRRLDQLQRRAARPRGAGDPQRCAGSRDYGETRWELNRSPRPHPRMTRRTAVERLSR